MRKTLIIIGVILAICLIVSSDVPSRQSNGGKFIRKWVTLGPILEGRTAGEAIEIDYFREGTWLGEPPLICPNCHGIAITLEGYPTQVRKATLLQLPEDGDVNRMFLEEGDVDYAVAYLNTFIESQEEMEKEILIRCDDAVRVWLNREIVYTSKDKRPLTEDEDRFVVRLKKGANSLSLKVADTVGDWTLSVRFADDNGLRFGDNWKVDAEPLGKRLIRLTEYKEPEWITWKTGPRKAPGLVDYLVSVDVNAIYQDMAGVMWFGTYNGLYRFDGKEWITYTAKDGLAHNYVYAILQDNEGSMWFGTRAGVSRFDEKEQNWITYT